MQSAEKIARVQRAVNEIKQGDFHLSFSSLSKFLISPRHFIFYKAGLLEPTKAMYGGSLFDIMLLDADNFDNIYFVAPEGVKFPIRNQVQFCKLVAEGANPEEAQEEAYASKDTKKAADLMFEYSAYIEALQQAGKRIIVPWKEYEQNLFKIEMAKYDPTMAIAIKTPGECQKKIYWRRSGYDHQGIIDKTIFPTWVYEVKHFSGGVQEHECNTKITYLYYDIQAICYLVGLGNIGLVFQWLCFDNLGNTATVTFDEDQKWEALKAYNYILKRLTQCILEDKLLEGPNYWSHRQDDQFIFNRPRYKSLAWQFKDKIAA